MHELQEETADPLGRSAVRHGWFCTLLGVAALLLLILLVVTISGGSKVEVPPVEDPAFTLNGVDYPQVPTMRDLLDRGWKRGEFVEKWALTPKKVA